MSRNNTKLLDTDLSVRGLFSPLLTSAKHNLNFALSAQSETYLLALLESGLLTQSVFVRNPETGFFDEPMLSERFLQALQEEQKSQKCAQLKQLGDSILFKAGFFSEALKRKLSGLSFHIQMGSSIFSSLYSDSRNPVHEDLSSRFSGYVDLISAVGQEINLKKPGDVLTLFDRCVEGCSQDAESKLASLGVPLIDIKKASNQ